MTDNALDSKQDYIERLKCHDWYYAYSDDGGIYRRGAAAAQTLSNLQKQVDPDFSLWNSHAPEDYKVFSAEARELGKQLIAEASKPGKTDIKKVKALIEAGAYINAKTYPGECTAVFLATVNKDAEVVDYLLSKGASPDIKNKEGFSPVMIACQNGQADILQSLIKANADIKSAYFKTNDTPLMMAVDGGHKDSVILLLLAGADPKVKNWKRGTAADIAQKSDQKDMIKIFEATPEALRKMAVKKGLIKSSKAAAAAKAIFPRKIPKNVKVPKLKRKP